MKTQYTTLKKILTSLGKREISLILRASCGAFNNIINKLFDDIKYFEKWGHYK